TGPSSKICICRTIGHCLFGPLLNCDDDDVSIAYGPPPSIGSGAVAGAGAYDTGLLGALRSCESYTSALSAPAESNAASPPPALAPRVFLNVAYRSRESPCIM